MAGPSTVLAISEMYRVAEETLPKVRQELYRLGCLNAIKVTIEDGYLRLHYCEQSVLVNPKRILELLQTENKTTTTEFVWEKVLSESSHQLAKTKYRLMVISGFIFLLLLAAIFFTNN